MNKRDLGSELYELMHEYEKNMSLLLPSKELHMFHEDMRTKEIAQKIRDICFELSRKQR